MYIALIVLALVLIYPVYYAFASAVMSPEESSQYPPRMFPSHLDFSAIRSVVDLVPIGAFIRNSFFIAAAITVGQVLTASLAAYAFTFVKMRFRAFWFGLFLSTMMIPWEVTIIPNYMTVKSLGWLDSYPGLIMPFLASAFGVFLLRQFFLQLPKELFEAAVIDGCGHWRYLARIVMPLSRPALASLAVYAFLNAWNMYLWPLLVTSTPEMRTVQIGISMLQFEEFTAWNIVLAGVSLVLLPSLIFLVLGLKQLVQGITAGAVKG